MTVPGTARPGPLGGADNELGGELRARVAAYVASFGLRGLELRLSGDRLANGVPSVVRCEVDEAVDDLEVQFGQGNRVLVQVKRHLDFDMRPGRPLAKVVEQWVDQVSDLASGAVPLVAIAGAASNRVNDLAEALDRRRDPYASAFTRAQAAALDELSATLVRLGAVATDDVLDRVSIAVIDLALLGKGGAAVAVSLLDGNVVAVGQGEAAFDALANAHRERAARRSGLDLDGWIGVLQRAQLDVLVDADGCRSARRAAEQAALLRYRDRLIGDGRSVDLLALGTDLLPIPIVSHTQVANEPSDTSAGATIELDRALRRHGRALLLGQPGSGKSTMLRWLAAREAERGWSTPVLVDLRRLLDPAGSGGRPLRMDSGVDPLDTLVEIAAAGVPLDDRALVANAIRIAAAEGSLLVGLDSLDETRQHRHVVVSWVRRLLERIDTGCDLVLATRTSAYAAAATLGWRELWVAPPRSADPIVLGVLEGFATRDCRASDWVEARLRWATDKVSQIPSLAATPLLLTALAVRAAQGAPLDEVTGPASLLETITEWVASNWERRCDRIGAELPSGLHSAQVSDALRVALARLAWAVISQVEPHAATPIQAELADRFVTEHGLAPGAARALAAATVHFWDEAGIIVLDRDGRLTCRARPVVEVAAARYVAGLRPTDRAAAMRHASAEPVTFEVLRLLMSLDAGTIGEVVDLAVASGKRDLLLAVASGLDSSTNASPTAVDRLVEAVIALRPIGETGKASIVRCLASLPVSQASRGRIMAMVETELQPAAAAVWRALLLHRWSDPTADDACRAATLAGPPPSPLPPSRPGRFRALVARDPTAEAFGEVMLATTTRLDAEDEGTAERIRQLAYHSCPRKMSGAIYRELGRKGFNNNQPAEPRLDWGPVQARIDEFDISFRWLLEYLIGPGTSSVLRVPERRRLERLGRLIQGLAINEFEIGEFEISVQENTDDVVAALEVFLQQGRFDRDAVAAEAASFLAEFQDDSLAWLHFAYEPPECKLDCWENADVVAVIASTANLFHKSYWLAYLALNILLQVPDSAQADAASAAASKAEAGLVPRQRRLAALVALHAAPNHYIARWRRAADPVLVGAVMEHADTYPDRIALLTEGVTHDDVLVRDEAVDQMSADDAVRPAVADALRRALDLPPGGTCRYCGKVFIALGSNCERCRLALPDPRSKIETLLRTGQRPADGDAGP